ncbi:hypothetical protein [Clostridium pasteurianum]|uniref:Uncharacterized protein n=1 Tax=Clostridium pasteurianum BC1 TaxID=86416 RepID=R4K422_CLOPA|nr:hypothetical protein [Clostridium pasteurianum]AGK97887.1 hypothetical protein Clopa_3059 [Clostridium pasteurianum BC1]
MIISDRNFYIIKQSDGTTWNFFYNKDEGIMYKFFKETTWSDHHVLTKKALNNFSAIILPDDSIVILYENLTGGLVLSKYNNKIWNEEQIMKNSKREIFSTYFKAIVHNNEINIIFSILNKKDNTVTLFHQIVDEKNNLSDPKMIEKIKNDHHISFNVYSLQNKELFILYQRFIGHFELGYKTFNVNTKKWSNFNSIDTNVSYFSYYSALIVNGLLNILYIKKGKNIDNLIYVHGKSPNYKSIELFKGINIELCSFFIVYGQIWCYWLKDKKIYNSFSINNGINFSSYPYEQSLNSTYIFKVIYISNKLEKIKNTIFNEIYITNYDDIKYLIFSNIYLYIKTNVKNSEYLLYIEYYLTEICEKVLFYEKTLKQKEESIIQIKYTLPKQNFKLLCIEKKHETTKNLFNKLKKRNIEQEKEIVSLKNELSKQENRILSLLEEIKNLQLNVNDLNSQLTKSDNSLLKKIFKNKHFS